jgi:natural product biosynthesis luciferase-like monooxygenase protein
MSNLSERIDNLSPQKRALLIEQFNQKSGATSRKQQAIATNPSTQKDLNQKMEFSLFFFGSDGSKAVADKYDLLIESVKFADKHGFSAVWTPERHFHPFGGLYPNPSLMGTALAMVTEQIQLRAGSVVMPLNHPIRVAEEWSVVDNLSRGRVGIAFASGWHANDFVFSPDAYTDRKEVMFRGIETVQRLWQGESIQVLGGTGSNIEVKLFPKPIQPQLPFWITSGGNPQTFIKAGELGANVLTNLLGQTLEKVAENIRLYRQSLAKHGHNPQTGNVTLMLHTFIADDINAVQEKVRQPFCDYIRTFTGLLDNLAKSLNLPVGLETLTAKDMDDLVSFAFDRYFNTSALFGTPNTCLQMIESLKAKGVDEVACLIDFGVERDSVLESLHYLNQLKDLANSTSNPACSSKDEIKQLLYSET